MYRPYLDVHICHVALPAIHPPHPAPRLCQASKTLYRYQRSLTGVAAMAARAAHTLVSAFHLAFLASVFIIIDWNGCLAAWRSVYFSGLISMAARCRARRSAPHALLRTRVPLSGRMRCGPALLRRFGRCGLRAGCGLLRG